MAPDGADGKKVIMIKITKIISTSLKTLTPNIIKEKESQKIILKKTNPKNFKDCIKKKEGYVKEN